MANRLTKRIALGVKTESAQNTLATLAATDFILAYDISYKPNFEILERNYYRASLDTLPSAIGKIYGEISFKTELKGSGTAGTPYAPLDALIQACGFSSAASGGVSVTYAPISAVVSNFLGPQKSCTIMYYEDGGLKTLTGCVGNMKLTLEAGKLGVAEFTLRGLYTEPSTTAFVAATYLAQLPAKVQNATFTIDASGALINKLEIDIANEIAARDSINSPHGLRGFSIAGRNPAGSMDPEVIAVGTYNFWSKLTSSATGALSVVLGATAGNIITITAPKLQYKGIDDGDRNGMAIYQIPFSLRQNSGDDYISIVMT